MRPPWDWSVKIPLELVSTVSRNALLLYILVVTHVDDSGVCQDIAILGALAGYSDDEIAAAVEELVKVDVVERLVVNVVVFTLSPDHVITRDRVDLKIRFFLGPLFMERLPNSEWERLRLTVFERDSYTCQYCGHREGELECDHVEPISQGGTNELGNLVTACRTCNRSKRDKQLDQWRARESA